MKMASLNKFIGIGNVTKKPELRYMPNGEAVCNFAIACNETWKDKAGEKKEKVEFINIVAYRKLAEIIGEYVKKGAAIYIEGRLQTRKWEKDGVTRYSTEIIGDNMQMLGSKDEAARETDGYQGSPHEVVKQDSKEMASPDFDDLENDIPF